MTQWKDALVLDSKCNVIAGSEKDLCDAIGHGADLRIYTEFIHNEHVDSRSDNDELVKEVSEFRATYLVENRWVAGIMTLRQPVQVPNRFGHGSSMSFFMYNQDGKQSLARLYLSPKDALPNGIQLDEPCGKYKLINSNDDKTNAPSNNFFYAFETFRYCVQDNWKEVMATDAQGNVVSGSIDDLSDAFEKGCELKAGIKNLCECFSKNESPEHEVFIQLGPGYYYTDSKLFIAETHPLVRVKVAIPMVYESAGWDYSWVLLKTDGTASLRICDPYALKFNDKEAKFAMRWFVR